MFLSQYSFHVFNAWVNFSTMHETVIVPNGKYLNGDVSDASNYRLVALATTILKPLQHYILSSISLSVAMMENQFV